jgi:drug/metabolite transporter (DMT)-like permease
LSLLFTAFLFGSYGVGVRAMNGYFSDFGQVFVRFCIAAIFSMLLVFFFGKRSFSIPKVKIATLGLFCLVYPFSSIFLTLSVLNTKATTAVFMLYSGSIVTEFFYGTLLLKEKLDRFKIISVLLTLVGLIIYLGNFNWSIISIGMIFGILAGLCDGLGNSLTPSLKSIPRMTTVFYQYVFGSFLAGLLVVWSGQKVIEASLDFKGVLLTLLFAGFIVSISYILKFGFEKIEVSLGSVILASELFFALVINYLFLHEIPTAHEAIGSLLIFLAIFMTQVDINKLSGKPNRL